MKKKYKAITIGLSFVILLTIVRIAGLHNCITVSTVHEHTQFLLHTIEHHYWKSVIAYIFLFTVGVAFSLPIALLCTVAGGYFYGVLWGSVYANIGATLGAMISFLLVRYSIGDIIQEQYAARLTHFNAMVQKHGARYLFLVHLVAFVPFSMVNILAGLTRVSWWTFMWTTSLGIIPTSLLYTYAGRRLAHISTLVDIFTFDIVLGIFLIAGIAALLLLYFRGR